MQGIDAAVNISKCVVERQHIGYTEYINACTGRWMTTVSWAGVDWAGAIGLSLLFLFLGLVLFGVCWMMIRDAINGF